MILFANINTRSRRLGTESPSNGLAPIGPGRKWARAGEPKHHAFNFFGSSYALLEFTPSVW